MDRRRFNGDASRLAGHFTEPYRQDAVIAAARTLAEPFTMREVANAAELPASVVHRCLCRLVRKGVFVRFKVAQTVSGLRHAPQIQVYAYRFVDRRA